MVPWMSGLVTGLQNRLRRFESARNLLGRLHSLPFLFQINEKIIQFFYPFALLHDEYFSQQFFSCCEFYFKISIYLQQI